jgi:hypothetical protein
MSSFLARYLSWSARPVAGVGGGGSLDGAAPVRRRLGHASTETTQLYALLDDKVADAEIRAAR